MRCSSVFENRKKEIHHTCHAQPPEEDARTNQPELHQNQIYYNTEDSSMDAKKFPIRKRAQQRSENIVCW